MRLLIGTPQPIVSGERMTAHMGMFEVKDQVYGFMGISPAAGSDPRSEPVSMTRWHAAPDQAHIRSPLIAAAPISRVRRGAGPFLPSVVEASRHFGSATWIRQDWSGPCGWGQIVTGAAFITAPLMTTPAVVYRHSAIRSLRARATMIVLRIRPPRRRTRSWNHRLSAEVGWFCSHSQASSTIVVLSRGLPALDTLLVIDRAALPWRRRQAGVGGHLPADQRTAAVSGPIPFSRASMAAGRARSAVGRVTVL